MSVQELGRAVRRIIAPLERRVALSIARAVIRIVNDDPKCQTVQISVLSDEVQDNVERFQEYGFTSKPFAGAEAAVVYVGGNRSHGIVVAVEDRRYRLKAMADGEVALYDDQGQVVHIKRDRILISSPTMVQCVAPAIQHDCQTFTVNAAVKAHFDTPLVEATGDIIDTSGTNGQSMAGMRTVYNGHTHTDPQGGTVSPPSEEM